MNYKKGFTLIELLVTIAIIAILSSIVFSSISSLREDARDARRVSDIRWFQTSLEETRQYISDDYAILSATTPTTIDGTQAPTNNSVNDGVYEWFDNTTQTDSFCVWATLENPEDGTYFVGNSSGTGYTNTEPTDIGTCAFEIGG